MQTPEATRLVAFAAILAVIAIAAAALGSATGATPPRGSAPARPTGDRTGAMAMGAGHATTAGAHAGGQSTAMAGMAQLVSGSDGTRLTVAGLTLAPVSERLPAGRTVPWRFRILRRDGTPLRAFDRDQTKLLHLIVARSDLTGYQHLHPSLEADGAFSVAMRLGQPGRYRAIADFTTGHRRYVLGTTLRVAGSAYALPLYGTTAHASVDGYDISLARTAAITAGSEAVLRFAVTRGGAPVADLQPYLGAYGHLVALRAGDLAYSHVHPTGENLPGGVITFDAELPRPGAYRLFLQFRTGGRVHTAAFTQRAAARRTSRASRGRTT